MDPTDKLLCPRIYRWVMGETRIFGAHLWFGLHVVFQLSGMVCFIVGFVYAWLYLPGSGNGPPTGGKVGQAHMIIGSAIAGLAGLQVLGVSCTVWSGFLDGGMHEEQTASQQRVPMNQ